MAPVVPKQPGIFHERDVEVILPFEPKDVAAGRGHVARARIPRPVSRVGGWQVREEGGSRNSIDGKLSARRRIDTGVVERFAVYGWIGEPWPVRADAVAVEVVS